MREKFGQGVYCGDGGWRAQIMGVVGGKRVAGLGGLGEWVSGRRLTAGGARLRAGHARPLQGGAKKKAGAGINFRRVSLSRNLYTSVTCFPLM